MSTSTVANLDPISLVMYSRLETLTFGFLGSYFKFLGGSTREKQEINYSFRFSYFKFLGGSTREKQEINYSFRFSISKFAFS